MEKVMEKQNKPLEKKRAATRKDLPIIWQGLLKIKNSRAGVKMHLVAGNPEIAMKSFPSFKVDPSPMKILQRMELEPARLTEIKHKVKKSEDYCILLALPVGKDHGDFLNQCTRLKENFINYFERKTAVGVINVTKEGLSGPAFLIHLFPPSDFTFSLAKKLPVNLLKTLQEVAHMMIIVTTV